MRTFIAIAIPDEIKKYACSVKEDLMNTGTDLKWVEYENYHLTLKFLGEVQEKKLPLIKKNLILVADNCPSFNLSTANVGFFPRPSNPRVMWLGIRGEVEKAAFLGERIDAYLSTIGFNEEKNHRFHLTLGRVRSEIGAKELVRQAEEKYGRSKMHTFHVGNFHLMESVLSPKGPVYKVISTYKLNG